MILGCPSPSDPFPQNKAIINDIAVRQSLDSGYRVIAVDGKPEERANSPHIITVAPVVLVDGGEHTLTLESQGDKKLPNKTLVAVFEATKRYRIKKDGPVFSVVEDLK